MTNRFTQKAEEALNRALELASSLGHTYIGSEHILLALALTEDTAASRILQKHSADADALKDTIVNLAGIGEPTQLSPSHMTPKTKRIIETAAHEATRNQSRQIGTEHLLAGILHEEECVAVRILLSLGVSLNELRREVAEYTLSNREEDTEKSEQRGKRGEAQSKISGAPTLSSFGRDLTAQARANKVDPIIGRDEETDRVIQILSRRQKNNPCLIGEPGVGKTAVVEGLAQRIVSGDIPDTLRDKKIVTLDISSMIAGAKYRGEFEERMKKVMEEVVSDPSIILFIDEIHTIVGAGAAEGAVDAANILKPALARGEMQLIGATTISEYRKYIEKDAALERRFQSVTVGEPTPEEAVLILRGLREKYEEHHKLKISDEAIEAAVSLSRRYISDRFLPDKAIDLIDEASSRIRIKSRTQPHDLRSLEEELKKLSEQKEEAVKAQNFESAASIRDREKQLRAEYDEKKAAWSGERDKATLELTADDIADVVTAWTGIPVKKLADEEGTRLKNLEELLRARVVGQDTAVSAISKAIRRGRMGLKDPGRPIGSFIFLGPTGVGKTELSKALAEVMFGDANAMIRVDMSELMDRHSTSKLIGSPPGYVGYEEGGQLTEKIRRKPYSVVLFDEIEKAHPDVFNILLQVLEDGILTDSQGRRVDFKNTIIIMTSNVGAGALTEKKRTLGFTDASSVDDSEQQSRAALSALKEHFRPEFLNRIDEIIVFNKLTHDDIAKIASIMLAGVVKRIEAIGVRIEFDSSVVELLAKEGFDEVYGARPLRRAVISKVEDAFSGAMLDGEIVSGDSVKALVRDGAVVFEKQ